jgi:hypothetical protein
MGSSQNKQEQGTQETKEKWISKEKIKTGQVTGIRADVLE